ncbi:MAPEG family protein [Curvibacter sp. CHRR-16]|uniref:MAPEG family protein n=1 Tax=Curvibacter sp. CHRR-16 TaxID=2835872 RepID=UPI001BDB0060|nr:MAPEG family protein [Curvibacter sp. CHRR-16]MBT0568743.1 MAPEG family protein [Curvibacter sp. CHRR-16]
MNTVHFTLAYWCVLIAAILPIVCAVLAKSGGTYDNNNPRAFLGSLTDWRARANGAQANSFESLPFFIGAVVIAHQLDAVQSRIDVLAFVYIFLRVLYIMAYVGGMGTVRSAIWALGFFTNIAILFIGYR